jgi:photosystem I subunit 8
MADMTQLTGAYAASWLPWIMIPMIFYILPFPIFAIIFLWIEREANGNPAMGQDPMNSNPDYVPSAPHE